jgi:hypothetical protein
MNTIARRNVLVAAIMVVAFAAALLLANHDRPSEEKPDQSATKATATDAGARVLPSEPRLKVEPK